MNRYSAFFAHLLLSASILSITLSILLLHFYPGFYLTAEGGIDALIILVGVDLILGPLITLIIYLPGKKGLKFDIACIGIAQLIALSYGCHVLYQERPIFLAYTIDRFETIKASKIDIDELSEQELRPGPLTPVQVVNVIDPDEEEQQEILLDSISGGKDMRYYPKLYRKNIPAEELAKHSFSPEEITTQAHSTKLLHEFLTESDTKEDDYYYLPLVGTKTIMLALVEKESLIIITALEIDPWDILQPPSR